MHSWHLCTSCGGSPVGERNNSWVLWVVLVGVGVLVSCLC